MTGRLVLRIGGAWVAENAVVTGDVTLGADASVWFFCSLRGDDAPIAIGARVNVQDHSMIHADPGVPLSIGEEVAIGHRAIVHCARIGARCLIGMGAILLAGAEIGEGSVVGAGAVVPEGMVVPPRSLVLGVPGRVVRPLGDEGERRARTAVANYLAKARAYEAGGHAWPPAGR